MQTIKQLDSHQKRMVSILDWLPPINKQSLFMGRASYTLIDRLLGLKKQKMSRIEEYNVPLSSANDSIAIRVYYPNKKTHNEKAMMYFHGGGCVIGNLASHDRICRYLAKKNNLVIIAVDYRLAPEAKFPAAINDSIDAWNWVNKHHKELGIDKNNIGVGGESAGGYLASLISLNTLHKDLSVTTSFTPKYQLILFPMMDLRGVTQSYKECVSGMTLTQDLMNYFRQHYLNNLEEANLPLASPILIDDFTQFPPTYLLTVEFDPLKDEGLAYGEKLKSAGVPLIQDHFDDCLHSFYSFCRVSPRAQKGMDRIVEALAELSR